MRKVHRCLRWSAEDVAVLKHMRDEGYPWSQISSKVSHTVNACRIKYYKVISDTPIPVYSTDKTVTIKSKDIAKSLADYPFVEILVYLRDNGFRIENNKLVRYTPIEFDFNTAS